MAPLSCPQQPHRVQLPCRSCRPLQSPLSVWFSGSRSLSCWDRLKWELEEGSLVCLLGGGRVHPPHIPPNPRAATGTLPVFTGA